MMKFSECLKLLDEFHAWAQEVNKKISGAVVDETSPLSFIAFLDDKGLFRPEPYTCTYTEYRTDTVEHGLWVCDRCNRGRHLEEGTPFDHEMQYCPFCGAKIIKEIPLEGEK